ncbi:MAG: acyl-ACP--UDP-N-acetylglucosamine O-acyltransferase [Acidobacteria bacterium]|nr:acyl-ACP--UDP-N-acetylglucosamine O-acyltransferase [Acidobacteriota bacterium]
MSTIHKTAVIDESAKIGEGSEIGPFAVIEKDVVIGKNNKIAAHAIIKSYTTLGDNNEIGESAIIGGKPQDLKFSGEPSYLKIGNNNIIREFVTLHIGTEPGTSTIIGDHCFLMGYVHVAHNCTIGNHVIVANYTAFSGHVTVGDYAFVSGGTLVHQNTRIGMMAMVGGGTRLRMDTLPFFTVNGDPAGLYGLNLIGLRRREVPRISIQKLREANNTLFYCGNSLQDALEILEKDDDQYLTELVEFIKGSKRGFHHPMKGRRNKLQRSLDDKEEE